MDKDTNTHAITAAVIDLIDALTNITECAEAGKDGANMDVWIEQARAALAKHEPTATAAKAAATRYVVAWYEIDRAFGGHEEGGWYFTTGQLVREFAVAKTEDAAYAVARRANLLIARIQRDARGVDSVIYSGGRFTARVFADTAPPYFPESRPYYE